MEKTFFNPPLYEDYMSCKNYYKVRYPEVAKLHVGETKKDVVCLREVDDPRFNTNIDRFIGETDEMNWGYAGTGPWLLALNILYVFTKADERFSDKYVYDFRNDFLMKNHSKDLTIKADDINAWIKAKKAGGNIVQ